MNGSQPFGATDTAQSTDWSARILDLRCEQEIVRRALARRDEAAPDRVLLRTAQLSSLVAEGAAERELVMQRYLGAGPRVGERVAVEPLHPRAGPRDAQSLGEPA